jgi:hypothetical protein
MTTGDIPGDEHQKQPAVVGAVSGRAYLGKKTIHVVIIVGIGVVLVTGAVTAYFIWSGRHAKKNVVTPKTATSNVVEPQSVEMVNTLLANGQPAEAAKTVNDDPSLKNSRDGQMLLAQVALNQNKYDDAIVIYKAIGDKFGWNANLADQVALCYASKNDKANEIVYYQKELSLLQANSKDPSQNAEIPRVQEQLKELQK